MSDFRQIIIDLVKETLPVHTLPGTVTAVDGYLCSVLPDDGPELHEVRLCASLDEDAPTLVSIPATGSRVLVSIIGNDRTVAWVARCDKAEAYDIKLGGHTARIDVDGIVLNGGSLGGLININELKAELAKINAHLTTLKTAFKTLAPGPLSGAALTAAAEPFGLLQLPGYENIEDTKIKH
jgi:hypothetical protein